MADAYTRALGGTVSGLLGMYEDWKRQPQMAALGGLLMGDTAPAKEWLGVGQPWPKDAAQQVKQGSYNLAMDWNNPMGLIGHTVWHGSPHKFDKFDMSKIGTGEGAQAYGHGLYFAESPEVAKGYQKTLANKGADGYQTAHANAQAQVARFGNDEEWAIDALMSARDGFHPSDPKIKNIDDTIKMIRDGSYKNPLKEGELYKVDIPDEILPRMLDWDKPLSQQAPEVQPVLRDMLTKARKSFEGIDPNGDPIAGQVHHLYAQHRGGNSNSPVIIADELRQAGIPGIRYLDGNSRGTGGTSNFVLFDDRLPRILERNGVPTGQVPWKDDPEALRGLLGM